ncbi:MAG: tRNA-specific adenosine deaminase [Firmicutes bacterium ADurb.Bin300]|nr:MAG: tRNA-specific adenosine deaminase [Firmicutes bacterium ADurb.Bin300]
MNERFFMHQAIELAREAFEDGEVPVGAVIVKSGEIVGRGRNRREKSKNALDHAEIEAINEACRALGGWRLWECDLFVTLEPCPMCAGAIVNARIRKVFFACFDRKNGAVGSTVNLFAIAGSYRPEYEAGINEAECSRLMSDFFKKLRK